MAKLTSADKCFICGNPLMYKPIQTDVSRPNMLMECPHCGAEFHQSCLLTALQAAGATLEQ